MAGTKVAASVVTASCRVDGALGLGLAGVLSWPVGGIRLCQAVGRVWADFRVAVKRVRIGAGGVLVQERAANFIFILGAVILQVVLVYGCVFSQSSGASYAGIGVPKVVTLVVVVGHDVLQSTGRPCRWLG